MNYGPKPLVEDHYHIQELIDAQEKRIYDRTTYRDRDKLNAEREDMIKEAQLVVVTDFWCQKCRKDFKSMSIKESYIDWTNSTQRIAFYRSKCDKGHWCIRLITDRQRDGFWVRSKLCALDKGNHQLDLVQPHETGYYMLYGKPK